MLQRAIALALFLSGAQAGAQERTGDAAAGRLVALRSCAACHAVSARETWYTEYARGFPEIARDPKLTDAELRRFIGGTHRMFWRGVDLSPPEIADVTAYILSLKPQR